MTVLYDITDGSATRSTQWGVQFTTSAIVYNLASAESEVQLDNAISEVGFVIGDTHPVFAQYTLTNIDAQHEDSSSVRIVYTWEYRFPEIQYEVGSTVVNEPTNIDRNGDIITVEYTYPEGYIERPDLVGETDQTSATIDTYIAETSVSITRQEVITGVDLVTKSNEYTGAVNGSDWNLFPVTGGFGNWLCTGINGISSDNGRTYAVRYTFSYRKDTTYTDPSTGQTGLEKRGWEKQVVFVDPRTGEPPADAGIKVVEPIRARDFNALGLS